MQDILADVPCLLSVSILNATLSNEAVNKINMERLCYLVSGRYILLIKCCHTFHMLITNVSGTDNKYKTGTFYIIAQASGINSFPTQFIGQV